MILMGEQVRGRPLPHLKAWRIQKLMTQADLIAKSGVARATLVRAERGDEIVGFANIRKLADGLGISAEDLLRMPHQQAADNYILEMRAHRTQADAASVVAQAEEVAAQSGVSELSVVELSAIEAGLVERGVIPPRF